MTVDKAIVQNAVISSLLLSPLLGHRPFSRTQKSVVPTEKRLYCPLLIIVLWSHLRFISEGNLQWEILHTWQALRISPSAYECCQFLSHLLRYPWEKEKRAMLLSRTLHEKMVFFWRSTKFFIRDTNHIQYRRFNLIKINQTNNCKNCFESDIDTKLIVVTN
jgi:hypothetical protein